MSEELVVLLDQAGAHIGTSAKAGVHTEETPLHLAFSCYLFNESGQLLVTRRALSKKTWPGVWTNSFCGHPGPGESFEDAMARRAAQELGTTITSVNSLLPDFRYRAVDASGIVENEICPVFTATITAPLAPNPDEVEVCLGGSVGLADLRVGHALCILPVAARTDRPGFAGPSLVAGP